MQRQWPRIRAVLGDSLDCLGVTQNDADRLVVEAVSGIYG